jgi:signal transduction histidine kinase
MDPSEIQVVCGDTPTGSADGQGGISAARAVLNALPSFLVALDGERRVLEWNPAAAEILGVPYDSSRRVTLRELNPRWTLDSDQVVNQALETAAPLRIDDVAYVRPDGEEGVLGLTVIPVEPHAGPGQFACVIIGSDVTSRRLLESKLAQSQRMESIGQLAAGIAHEINTPIQYVGDNTRFLTDVVSALLPLLQRLQALVGGSQVDDPAACLGELRELAGAADLDFVCDEVPQALQQSEEGLGRVASIVRAMKQFSHPGTKDKIEIDLNQAIQNTITVSRNEWKYVAELETDLDPDLPAVACLSQEFNQVILNLIVNAAHAIRDVNRDAQNCLGRIGVTTRCNGPWAELTISDTGGGIPEGNRQRVFDPFFTTKRVGEGTGQGLAIAYNVVVEKHQGEIFFDCERGRGTTFTVRLPLSAEPAEPSN